MRTEVKLYIEQRATVIVDAEPGASTDELTRLAMLELDASGGAEWVTECGWTESRPAPTQEEE